MPGIVSRKEFKMIRITLILVTHLSLSLGQVSGPNFNHAIQNTSANSVSYYKYNLKPKRSDTRVQFSILEGQDANTLVGVIPKKLGYTYRFSEPLNYFYLNKTSGEIRTNQLIDRESLENDVFDLVVLSSQPTYPIEVSITVLDVNDNSPKFPESSISISFSENANIGTRVILDTARDEDSIDKVISKYKIVGGNDENKFKLDITMNPSGEKPYLHLETSKNLDREDNENYQLSIIAEDSGNPPLHGSLLVNISVLDVNDNSPTFDHSDYVVSLSESVGIGTYVLQVKATDSDSGENSRLSYYVANSVTQFSVNSKTGVISTSEKLNCRRSCSEGKQCSKSCVFTVFARDHGSPPQEGRTYVTVNLEDANDHDPVINFRYFSATNGFASVDENAQNGSVVAVVSVIDADEGLNGETTAEIKGGNEIFHFRLDTRDSFDLVRVNGVLDREKINKYNVTIVASDKGVPRRSSTAFLIIHVNDINDHEPVFEKSEYSAILSELVPIGTYVASITANDEDTGINSNIFYDITDGNDEQWFDIDRQTGLITTKAKLDREINDSVHLKISARDGGPNPKRTFTFLKVIITDENDEVPTFRNSSYYVSLLENAPQGTKITTLKAFDKDRGTNGSISYYIDEESDYKYPKMFSVDSLSGKLILKSSLDREEIPLYIIKIVAKDQGVPSMSSTVTINLKIDDINDNNPVFYPQHYFVTVAEDLPIGSKVVKVTAIDRDEGENALIAYELFNSNDINVFEIDERTGSIVLSGRLSRIKNLRHRLYVSAKDKFNKKSNENAVVDVLIRSKNVREVSFKFKNGYKFIVAENFRREISTNSEIGEVSLDVSSSEKVTYAIISGDPDNIFNINKHSGVIKTIKTVDREVQSEYSLQILATTISSYGFTRANITVEDVNDNAPAFKSRHVVVYVEENWPMGHEIYLASAEDMDHGPNKRITYVLSKNDDHLFYISSSTGMIYLKNTIKDNAKDKHEIEVTAVDNGIPRLSSKLSISIYVKDVNDHTPVFPHKYYDTSLLESTPVNSRFFALTASDKDSGLNSLLSYDIVDGNKGQNFGMFPDGYLYVKRPLDRETKDYFSLSVIAKDHGTPARTSTTSVTVHILDENDNSPKFKNSTFVFYLNENESPDTYVGRIIANDFDKGRNAELKYTLSDSRKGFIIDSRSGFLKTTQYFDRENLIQTTGVDYVEIESIVYDNGVEKLSDKCKIIVKITDVNDNAPVFIRKSFKFQISEKAKIGTNIMAVTANDKDEGLNSKLMYFIASGNEENSFRIEKYTGQITVKNLLDRERTSSYNLIVAASDSSVFPLSSSATVSIDVLDENDNAPLFNISKKEIYVPENMEVNSVLYRFFATDADLSINKQIFFSISARNSHEIFHIETKTGRLTLNRPLDYEQSKFHVLNITAYDGGVPRLSSSIVFKVNVEDFNDNPPSFPNTALVRQIQEHIPVHTSIVTLKSTDLDSGPNARVKYRIISQEPVGSHFSLDENTGVIRTEKFIDREFSDTFKINVVAEDQAIDPSHRLKTEKIVTIIVEDINDNAPIFVSMNAAILPVDAIPGYKVIKVLAEDKDAGINGQVYYDMIDGNSKLFLLERNGFLRLKQKVMSSKIMYELKIRAADEADRKHVQYFDEKLFILVQDPLNEGPQFSKTQYEASITEGVGIGTSIAKISAKLNSNPRMKISFHIIDTTNLNGQKTNRMFYMDGNVLKTAVELDRDTQPQVYLVTVAAAVVQGNTPRVSMTNVKVSILDLNDTPPSFGEIKAEFSASEQLLPGESIGKVSATDPDTVGTLVYSLESGHDGKFSLNPETGALVLKNILDREDKDQYEVVVGASDGVHHVTTTIFISVTDANDNPPKFEKIVYSFEIEEHSERGTQAGFVKATDRDAGVNGHITYSVISDWGNDVFTLNPQTGVFTLSSHLDYEQVEHYIFVVKAEDAGQPPLSSTVTVYFNVLDLNDNAPIFETFSYTSEIDEDAPVGSTVLTVSASDLDSGSNGKISYKIDAGDVHNQFSIKNDGSIVTIGSLDREKISSYDLVIFALDMAQPEEKRLSSSAQVTINIRDVNDMTPEFVTGNSTSIAENTPLNTIIIAIKAVDEDEGQNSFIEYHMEPVKRGALSLGSTDGLLRVSGNLDREEKESYSLRITAKDRGYPSNSKTLILSLKILDENDNSPLFDPKQYSASISENASIGVSILKVSATDVDYGPNGRVHYSIVAGDKNRDFYIGEDTGIIRVAKRLNYESHNHYLLTVQAEDTGDDVRYDTSTVTVSVIDINDNEPIFYDSPYFIYVMENMKDISKSIGRVTAFDADNSPYNTISYQLKDNDRTYFYINSSTGDINLKESLDRERRESYTLTVIARDSGTPRLTGTGTVSIIVRDVNDHAPQFEKTNYEASVLENSEIGIRIITITATDQDEGANADIRYRLIGGHTDTFAVDLHEGFIYTKQVIDRETLAQYFVILEARDSSLTEPKSARAKVTIDIRDENDNAPTFENEEVLIFVPSNIKIGDFIYGGSASDADEGENSRIIYDLDRKDASKFHLDQWQGILKASTVLEENSTYDLLLKAQDFGNPPLFSRMKLKVRIKSSKLFPVFRPSKKFFSFNEKVKNVIVTTVKSNTPIHGKEITYDILAGNVGEAFEINKKDGTVKISSQGMNFEKTKQYNLYITASDNSSPSFKSITRLTINVTDYNDNLPIFSKNIYESEVLEDLYPPQFVAQVSATDLDAGINSEISYGIRNHKKVFDIFDIDRKTGRITTKNTLNREKTSKYDIIVDAIDSGTPSLSSTTTVRVNVKDKNNNPPRFTRLFSVNVTENAEIGAFVIQVTSSDKDEGENAKVKYSFTQNPDEKFSIDQSSGNVTVAREIDREVKDEYFLKVSASDGSWKAETPLTISVQDENDNAPLFSNNSYEFNFPELQRAVAFVGQVQATDEDKSGSNSAISYLLKLPSDFFSVDSISGEILSKQSLKYKNTFKGPSPENQYHFNIIATDKGKPPMSSEVSVTVNVIDVNVNAPKFIHSNFYTPVLENAEIGSKVIQCLAKDLEDYGINAEINYEIVSGNGTNFFVIDRTSGWLKVHRSLSNQIGNQYNLKVKSVDKGIPPLEDNALVTLVVSGKNKYQPKFTASSYQVIIAENEKIGTKIGTVKATDEDEGPNGVIKYSILSGDESKTFSIDESSGEVYINSKLDYETIKEYHLKISAKDLAFEPKSSIAVLTIILTDVNDNPPVFDKNTYHAYISENAPIKTSIFKLEATDADSAQNSVIHFSAIGGNGFPLFSVNAKTGVISSKKVFNFEDRNKFLLEVSASNPNSKQQESTKVIIHVTGENEYYPKFVRPIFQFNISESAKIGTPVGRLEAMDKDHGEDGIIYYYLVGSSNNKGFAIESKTGILKVSRNLDRERQNRVVLSVLCKNAGSIKGNDTDNSQIVVTIKDGNDPPSFEKTVYNAKIIENSPIGTEVIKVKATDSDVNPQHSQFSYTIIGGNLNNAFKIDPQSGFIRNRAKLDREANPVYNLTIGAIDNGTPSQTGTALVLIHLEDINDNGPKFKTPTIIGYVAENEPPSTSVMTISATDSDLPPNAEPYAYFIVGGEHKDYFIINSRTGTIKTTRTIDREITPELKFIIDVYDNGKPKMKSTYPVKIVVIDKNDSPLTSRILTLKVISLDGRLSGDKLADVRPNDQDISGKYKCRIIKDEKSAFIIPKACDLHLRSWTRHEDSYSILISGNDGKFSDATSEITVKLDSFESRNLDNSIIFRAENVTKNRFLKEYYKSFVSTINRLFKKHVVNIYSLTTADFHSDLTIAAESLTTGNLMSSAELSKIINRNVHIISKILPGVNFVINYDPCEENICQNGGTCLSKIKGYSDVQISDSPSLILTTPTIKREFNCKCHQGFAGEFCQLRQDPCSPNPCKYGGICNKKNYEFVCKCPPLRNGKYCERAVASACENTPCKNGGSCQETLEGGFFCLCRPGFRGNYCESETESCRPNPCQNGGNCVSTRPGYHCECLVNYYGINCEKSTFSFEELSFMTFKTLDSTTNDISIVLSTNKPNSLLIYNYGLQTGGRSDFIAIEIANRKPKFSYGGIRTEITSITVNKNVADGYWYKITATRNGRVVSLGVSNCSSSGEVCQDCASGNENCYASAVVLTETLNFNNEPMYLGGLMTVDPIHERPNQVFSDDFVGCIQSVSISGRPLNLSSSIQKRGISNVCKRIQNPCNDNPCGLDAKCVDMWSQHKCICHNGFLAPNCGDSLKPITFEGNAYVEFTITEQHRRRQLLPKLYQDIWMTFEHNDKNRIKKETYYELNPKVEYYKTNSKITKNLSLKFRTAENDGVILHASTNTDYTLININEGNLVYLSKHGANKPINVTTKKYNDGNWHTLEMSLTRDDIVLKIDDVSQKLTEVASMHDFLDAYLTSFTIGSAPYYKDNDLELKGFFGCMSTFVINGEIQPFNATSNSVLKSIPHHINFDSDCSTYIGTLAATNPISVGITLVIVFFCILFVAMFVSFVAYKFRKDKKEKEIGHAFHNGSALMANTSSESGRNHQDSGYIESTEMAEEVLRSHLGHEIPTKKFRDRDLNDRPHQRPDIIERETRDIINKSPGNGYLTRISDDPHGNSIKRFNHLDDQPEHYDLENASSIAPSDIDVVYHYKGYRDGNIRKYKTNPHVPAYHKHNHRHSPLNFSNPTRESPRNILRQSPNNIMQRESPSVLKIQSTPLARLSPSSEMSQQTPRILTLKDLSGKPLQTALLASQGGVKDAMSNSERSLNSPVSHLSHSTNSLHTSTQSTKRKKKLYNNNISCDINMSRLTPNELVRLNAHPRINNSSLTLEAVTSSDRVPQARTEKISDLLEANTELLGANLGDNDSSSTDESGNDSFTCSEFEYENTYEKVTRDHFSPGNMIFSKVAEENENEVDNLDLDDESNRNYDTFDSFRGSLSTLVASDDDVSNMSSYKPRNGNFSWDQLLNWGPNYNSFAGVFRDIAELPDNSFKDSEEYV